MRILRRLFVGMLLASALAAAQTQPTTFNVTATAQCGAIRASNNSTVGIIVSGTWSGTLTPNVQISTAASAPTVAKKVVPVDSTTAQATITANGGYRADIAGFTQFNVCSTGTWTSGTAIVTLYAVNPPAASTVASGSGGGGVTAVTGTAPVTSSGGTTPAIGCATCATTGTGVSGDYSRYSSASGIQDSTVVAGPYAIGWTTEFTGGNNGYLSSSTANDALMWGVTLWFPLTTTQITYSIGSNADNTSTYNYDLGLFNSAGTLVLNVSSGNLHGSTFAPATGPVTLAWSQGSTTLQPGNYYLMYYTSEEGLTATPATLISPSATAFTFYKGEAAGTGTCGTTQGSGGFPITPRSGGILPTSITAPANSYSWSACLPTVLIH